jgi:protein-tyrosine kinase
MKNRVLARATAATLTDSFSRSDSRSETLAINRARESTLQVATSDEMYRIAARLVTAMKPGEKVIACTGVSAEDPSAKFTLDLGVALARLGHSSVMVVDGNFRNPAIHAAIGKPSSPGLSELLVDSGAEVSTIRLVDVPNLQILTAGEMNEATPAALTSAAFGSRLQSFRECELVLMDIGPLLVSPESVLLASAADVVVAALANGERSRKDLLRLKHEVMRLNSRFLGVVLAEAQ